MINQDRVEALHLETPEAAVRTVVFDPPPVARSRSQIIKDSGHYLAATLVAQGVGMIRSVMMPWLFSPAQLGVWNLMNVVISYGEKAQLGLLDGMNKSIPLMRGEGRHSGIVAMKDTVFWTNAALAVAVGAATWLSAFFVPSSYAMGLRIIAIVNFLQLPFAYMFSLLRVDNRFGLLSRGVTALSVFSTILIIVLAIRSSNHLKGALFGLAAAYFLVVCYWLVAGRYRFALRIDLPSLRQAFVVGVPLKMLGVLDAVFLSVDRWVIASRFGETTLGYYALAIMVSSLLGLVPGSVASVLYTRMLERYAVAKDPRSARTLLIAPLRALAALMVVLTACAMTIIPVVIAIVLPKYDTSIRLVQILVVGGYFLSIGLITATYLTAINRQVMMLKLQVMAIVFSLAGNIIVMGFGFGVQGVAVVTAAAYTLMGLAYTIPACHLSCADRAEAFNLVSSLVVPVLIMVAATTTAYLIFPARGTLAAQIGSAAIRSAIVLVCVGGALWYVNRDGQLLAIVRTELKLSRWFARQT